MDRESAPIFEFGAYRLDAAERLLFRGGERIHLPPKAVDTLVLLLSRHGHVVTKEELLASVWPNVVVEENALARTISLLRRTLAADEADESCIETIPRRGYRFLPTPRIVSRSERLPVDHDEPSARIRTPSSQPVEPGAPPQTVSARRRRRMMAFGGIALACLAALAFLALQASRRQQDQGLATEPTAQLAVLPFQLAQADRSASYLSLALPDAITTRLANVRTLRVRPTVTVLRATKNDADPQRSGRALAVDHVLTGVLHSGPDKVRINLQMVRVSDGVPVWGESVEVEDDALARIEDHPFVERLTDALRLQITELERERLFARSGADPVAYEAFLNGRAALAQHDEQAMRSAARSFQEAIARDPAFAAAHAGLARASAEMALRFASKAETEEWHQRAVTAAQEALRLDPYSAEANEAMCAIHRKTEFRWDGVLEHCLRALEVNPSLEQAYFYIAGAYYHLGLFEGAADAVARGIEANPAGDLVEGKRSLGVTQLLSGRFAEARATFEAIRPQSDPRTIDHYLANAIAYEGDTSAAMKILDELSTSSSASASSRARATKAALLAEMGQRQEATALALAVGGGAEPRGQAPFMDHHVAYALGTTWAQLHQLARAAAWLEYAADTGFPCYPWLERDRLLAGFRADPAGKRYLEKMRAKYETLVGTTPRLPHR